MSQNKHTCSRLSIGAILEAPEIQSNLRKKDPKATYYVYDRNAIMRAAYGTDIGKPVGTCVNENAELFRKMFNKRRHWGSLCDRRIYLVGIVNHSRYVCRDIYHMAVMYYDKDGEFRYRSKSNGMYQDYAIKNWLDDGINLRRIFVKATNDPEKADKNLLEKLESLGWNREEILLKPVNLANWKKRSKSLLIIPSQVILQELKFTN